MVNDINESWDKWLLSEITKPENEQGMETAYKDCWDAAFLAGMDYCREVMCQALREVAERRER